MKSLRLPAYKIFALFVVLVLTFKGFIETTFKVQTPGWFSFLLAVLIFVWGTYEKYREGKLKQWLLFAAGLLLLIGLISFLQLVVFA